MRFGRTELKLLRIMGFAPDRWFTGYELTSVLGVSRTYGALPKLRDKGAIEWRREDRSEGRPPRVFYRLARTPDTWQFESASSTRPRQS